MKKSNIGSIISIATIVLIAYFIALSCANRGGGPQGGPKDTEPPKPLKSEPSQYAVHYKKNRIEIVFDEIVQIEKAFDNVIVSPPQKQPPTVKALGRKVIVDIKDSIKENTTYTIDFGNAIVDNNEKNILKGYSFAFSSGNDIDSLKISGVVLSAENLNPISNILVGIHSDLSDSAFREKPFDRITRTDNNGKFTISNIKDGKYHIYALEDIGGNYTFDMPNEQIAFIDSIITPTFEVKEHIDTVFRDSIITTKNQQDTIKVIDSIGISNKTHFYPNNILLRAFLEKNNIQYLDKSTRVSRNSFSLFFKNKNISLPKIEGINCNLENNLFMQTNKRQDTITYWLKDSTLWQMDTLQLKITYMKSDSLQQLVQTTDTLNLVAKKTQKTPKKDRRSSRSKTDFLNITTNLSTTINFFDKIEITSPTPIDSCRASFIHLEEQIDTVWKPISAKILPIDSSVFKFYIKTEITPSKTYRLTIDSATFVDIYGKHNNKSDITFRCKPKDSYSSLTLEMGRFGENEIVELLDKDDKVIKQIPADKSKITFEFLDEGIYYARLFIDENGNSIWDTGDYKKNIEPEKVYYYPSSFKIRQMWDAEEYWDYLEFDVVEQKPKELLKTKSNTQ